MNQTIAHPEYSITDNRSKVEERISLINELFAQLNKMVKVYSTQISAKPEHQSFIDDNLLDDIMGPEISRTLRR